MLTIITASYNPISKFGTDSVLRCLKSVAALPLAHEHLVMDGGSIDGTLEFIDRLDMPSLRLYSEKDYGIYDALNKGIAIAKGDFVYVLGLDDYIESPNNMALAYNFAIDGNYDITISPVKLSNGVVVPVKKKDIFNSYYKMAFCHQGVLCRTVTLLNLKGFEGLYRFISDWLFLYTAIAAGGRIKYFDKVFCVYGITGCSSKQIFFAEQEQLECLMKIYPRARKDVVKYGIIPSMDIFKLLITRSSFAKKCGLRALKKKMFLKVKHKGYKTFYILGHKVLNFCRKTHLFK